ncbi:RNA polymerase factor sigma-54 [Anaerotignum sp.]
MELSLQLQQKQTLSLRQQQSVEILQMNALALSEYARELAEDNPLVEWSEEEASLLEDRQALLQKMEWLEGADEGSRSFYVAEQEAEEREDARFGSKDGQSLREYLVFQINIRDIPEGHKAVLRFLAESTAESGYLEADAVEMMLERYPMREETAARILAEFQSLDPVGVGARDLRECLLIQLKQKDASAVAVKLAENYLEEVAKNHLSYIAKQLKTNIGEITAALQEIRSCQPKPGSGFAGEDRVEYVIPDILVMRKEKEWVVIVNGNVMPHLQISRAYMKMLREGANAETEEYISEKLKQAEWALQCISRRETTLQQVAECIVRRQEAFFADRQGQLAPLRLMDVAEELDLHVSTVSRSVKGKYLQCDRGVFPLHAFFSKAMPKAEMETQVSADSIRERLKTIIGEENKRKPLSDRELTEKLVAEGVQISRRTVAKYREAMGIPGAGGRKEY